MNRHFRDSWNVWREKVNAALGTVEQIDASEVLFDKTGTSITSGNVQGAIEEINSAVENLEEVIDDTWQVKEWGYEEVIGDGVKTYQSVFNELSAKMADKVAALADNEKLVAIALNIGGVIGMPITAMGGFYNTDTFALQCMETVSQPSKIVNYYCFVANSDSVYRFSEVTASAVTFTNASSSIMPSERIIQMHYKIYKQV